ncbi:MAG: TraR/DksA C4-type zinc finger protein [bacterium]
MKKDTSYFKKILEAEKVKLETELSGISQKNPRNLNDWEAVSSKDKEDDEREPDRNEVADNLEDYEQAFSLNAVIEGRLNDVKRALKEIEDGVYGICSVGGKNHEIEDKRLEANPAAITCIEHKED